MNNILRIICVVALGVPVLSGGKKNINLELETSVLFEPQDTHKHMELISDARRFLDVLENAIMPKKALRDSRPKQSLTDFISRLAHTFLKLYEPDLETFFQVLENEMKSQFIKGSIFREIVYDPKLQTFFRNKLKEWANTDPRQMKAKLRQYMARDANGNDTLHELGLFLNDYYGREQEFKMDEIIKRLTKTLDKSEISFIVRDALNTLVLQHYDKMNYTTRAKLVGKINTIKHEFFTSHVDHDLMLTFRRKRTKPKEINRLHYMDAWLNELENKGPAVADIDLNDVDVQVPAEDKDAPVLTLDDWDNWLSKRNMKGVRKVHTLMSDSIEKMIKDVEESKLKNKLIKVRTGYNGNYVDEPQKVKTATDFGLKKTVIDEPIDEPEEFRAKADSKRRNEIDESTDESRDKPERVKTTPDSKLKSRENDESTDKPEKLKITSKSTLRTNENDKYIDELKKSETSGFKFRKNDFDVSKDEPEKVRTSADSKSGSNENDESTDETTAVSKVGNNKNNKSTTDSKLEKGKKNKDFKSKHKHRHKTMKHKPMKFKADFILGNRNDKESKDFKLRINRAEEDETKTSIRNKGLATVDVFSQAYGIKPNKELIIDKNLEIFVGRLDATLVGNDKKK